MLSVGCCCIHLLYLVEVGHYVNHACRNRSLKTSISHNDHSETRRVIDSSAYAGHSPLVDEQTKNVDEFLDVQPVRRWGPLG